LRLLGDVPQSFAYREHMALDHFLLDIRSLPDFLQQLIMRNQAPRIVD
jgi:hypothetical protein